MRCIFSVPVRSRPSSIALVAVSSWALAGCLVSTTRDKPIIEDDGMKGRLKDGTAKHYGNSNDSKEISRSVGAPGGVVVLWPRIIPRTDDAMVHDIAFKVQARLERIAGKAATSVDRRPEPERVCPRGEGCRGASLGAVLAVKDKGCAVVAVVGPAGPKDERLVSLAGTVSLRSDTVAFRDPPENNVTVQEFVPCEKLLADLDANASLEGEEKVREAVDAALKRP